MHDDDDKPVQMGPRASRCREFCGGWRDPDTFGMSGGFHLNVTAVQTTGNHVSRVHGYWCAGGLDPLEPLVVAFADGRTSPVRLISVEPPPDPRMARTRPHLRWFIIDSPSTEITRGACIKSELDASRRT